jgi:hypothetical protein
MESMARMPSSMKLHGRSGKDIFKKAMTGILPDEILRRNKQGFTIPVAQWFRGELKDVAYSLISPPQYFNIGSVILGTNLGPTPESVVRPFGPALDRSDVPKVARRV